MVGDVTVVAKRCVVLIVDIFQEIKESFTITMGVTLVHFSCKQKMLLQNLISFVKLIKFKSD